MNNYKTILFIVSILAICFVIYLLYRFIVLLYKVNRLNDLGLNSENPDISLKFRYRFLYKFANILSSMTIFNSISRTYDKYIDENSKLRKGIDYIAIKILFGLSLSIIYIFMMMLTKDDISLLFILITFILGFIIPDFYCYFIYHKKENINNKELLGAVIIMSNSYRAGRSTEQALKDVIEKSQGRLKREFIRVHDDIKLGLSSGESFNRMYERTNLKVVKDISNMLILSNKSNINIVASFNLIEKKLLDNEKYDNEVAMTNELNHLVYMVFLVLPIIIMILVILSNNSLLMLIGSSCGNIIVLILLILYILYFFIINKVVKGRYL